MVDSGLLELSDGEASAAAASDQETSRVIHETAASVSDRSASVRNAKGQPCTVIWQGLGQYPSSVFAGFTGDKWQFTSRQWDNATPTRTAGPFPSRVLHTPGGMVSIEPATGVEEMSESDLEFGEIARAALAELGDDASRYTGPKSADPSMLHWDIYQKALSKIDQASTPASKSHLALPFVQRSETADKLERGTSVIKEQLGIRLKMPRSGVDRQR